MQIAAAGAKTLTIYEKIDVDEDDRLSADAITQHRGDFLAAMHADGFSVGPPFGGGSKSRWSHFWWLLWDFSNLICGPKVPI